MGTLASRLVGAWTLESYTTHGVDGTLDHPLGEEPIGVLVYGHDGGMTGLMSRRDRPPFNAPREAPVARSGSAVEVVRAFNDVFGYGGSYTVDEERGEVLHHVAVCVLPDWPGRTLPRRAEMSEDGAHLTLTSPARVFAGVEQHAELRWARSRPPARGLGAVAPQVTNQGEAPR
jgi:hypothetical protein